MNPQPSAVNGEAKVPPPRKNRAWIGVFVVLALLGMAAVVSLVAYNFSQQLRPEQLATARALWKQKEPLNYEFRYTTLRTGATRPEHYYVRVRNRQVVHLTLDDRPLESRHFSQYSMSGLFGAIKQFLDMDSQPNKPRTFTRAEFDEETGALRRYVRRVMGSNERIEIRVEEVRVLTE